MSYNYQDIRSARRGVLLEACQSLNDSAVQYVVARGWVPYLRSSGHRLDHPGTKDVDLLFNDKPGPIRTAGRTDLASINETRLFFAQFSAGAPLLFLHGGLGNSNYWGNQIEEFAAKYSVLVMDTRGHGRSPNAALTLKQGDRQGVRLKGRVQVAFSG
jgi:pimeloyl-ACP methyl ester carboxylesterase